MYRFTQKSLNKKMKNTIIFVVGAIICLLIGCTTTKKYASPEELKLAEFDEFIENMENEYIYLDTRMDEFDCIKKTYRNEAIHLSDRNAHVLFYETIMMEFWDSHLQLNTNLKSSFRVDYTIYSEFVNGATQVKSLWQTQLRPLPEENIIDAEIVSFNGVPFQQAIDDFPTRCQDKEDPKVRTWLGNKILSGRWNEPRNVVLKLSNGSSFELNIDAMKEVKESTLMQHKRIGNVGYIRINDALDESDLVNDFNLALNELMNTEALILDLRNTESGGNTGVAKPILGRFISEKKPYQLYENKKKKYFGYVKPKGPTYTQPLYVLANKWTGSMGEGVAVALDGMDRATIIGTEMDGLRGGMKGIKMMTQNFSYFFSFEKIFHIDGTPREEFVPEIYVRQTQHSKDEALEMALTLIKDK